MANSRLQKILVRISAVTLSLSLVFGFASCSFIDDIREQMAEDMRGGKDDDDDDNDDRHETNSVQTRDTYETSYETFEPTGTYTTEPLEMMDVDAEYIRSIYVYTTWYDIIDDNPVDYYDVASEDAFALKNVFYFNTPITVTFEARLYKDDDLLLTKEVVLKNNVTAEVDFSAGLEGLGTFGPGTYTVQLLYLDEEIAYSRPIEVT